MPAQQSSFTPRGGSSVPFQILIQNSAYTIQQTPKVITRYQPTRVGTVKKSITGVPALQEIDRQWKPIILVFGMSEQPPALMSDAMLAAFIAGMNAGGTQTLVLEGTSKTVIFDWSSGMPLEYNEVTPTGEQETVSGSVSQRLFAGTVRFLELL